MQYVYLNNNIVQQFISDEDPIFPGVPIAERYAPYFLAACVEVSDDTDVQSGYIYDPSTQTFSAPPEPDETSVEEPADANIKSAKHSELNAACSYAITNGCDVTLSDGTTGNISLTAEDQINLSTALQAVDGGDTGYPYHLDGELCTVFSATDIRIIATAATAHKLYHTTLCNHYYVWVNRCATAEEVQAITYGCELPGDLQSNMEAVINAVST